MAFILSRNCDSGHNTQNDKIRRNILMQEASNYMIADNETQKTICFPCQYVRCGYERYDLKLADNHISG